MWLVQANSGKVQSFSKFQAELRAQHKHSKGRHKHKREKQQQPDRHETPKATLQTAGNHADTTQVSRSYAAVPQQCRSSVGTLLECAVCISRICFRVSWHIALRKQSRCAYSTFLWAVIKSSCQLSTQPAILFLVLLNKFSATDYGSHSKFRQARKGAV